MKKRLEVEKIQKSRVTLLSMSRSADRETLTILSNPNALVKAKGNNLLLTLAVAKNGSRDKSLVGFGVKPQYFTYH